MITGKFQLKNYANWKVVYFIVTDADNAEAILNALDRLRCNQRFMKKAESLLYSNSRNMGLVYTKPRLRTSVFVVSKTTSVWEFFNTFAHEVDHVEKHIAKALGFSPYSEKASYLVGELIKEMLYNIFKKMLC